MKEVRLGMHWLEACYEFKLQSAHQKSSQRLEQCAQKQEDTDSHESTLFLNCLATGSHPFSAQRNLC